MPEIRVQYIGGSGGHGLERQEAVELKQVLRGECVRRFSLPDFPLEPSNFDFVDESLGGASELAHNVIIRISLHNFSVRYEDGQGQEHADSLAALVRDFLNTEEMIAWHGRRSVGVSLLFAHIEWSSA